MVAKKSPQRNGSIQLACFEFLRKHPGVQTSMYDVADSVGIEPTQAGGALAALARNEGNGIQRTDIQGMYVYSPQSHAEDVLFEQVTTLADGVLIRSQSGELYVAKPLPTRF